MRQFHSRKFCIFTDTNRLDSNDNIDSGNEDDSEQLTQPLNETLNELNELDDSEIDDLTKLFKIIYGDDFDAYDLTDSNFTEFTNSVNTIFCYVCDHQFKRSEYYTFIEACYKCLLEILPTKTDKLTRQMEIIKAIKLKKNKTVTDEIIYKIRTHVVLCNSCSNKLTFV